MLICTVHFADGGQENFTVTWLATESFRHLFGDAECQADAQKADRHLVLEAAQKKFGSRPITKIVRTLTGETLYGT